MKITIENLPGATAEDVFDTIIEGLFKQGRKARAGKPVGERAVITCMMRAPNGDRCAAGQLIDNPDLAAELDEIGESWDDPADRGLVPDNHSRLIRELQVMHDSYSVQEWPESARTVARLYSLDASVVGKFEHLLPN